MGAPIVGAPMPTWGGNGLYTGQMLPKQILLLLLLSCICVVVSVVVDVHAEKLGVLK